MATNAEDQSSRVTATATRGSGEGREVDMALTLAVATDTGLGLSIVKHVAASHGGDVRVWSVEGQGSTFTLTLPRKQDVPHKAETPEEDHP